MVITKAKSSIYLKENSETELVDIRQIESLEIEIIKKYIANQNIVSNLIQGLELNQKANQEELLYYTDSSLLLANGDSNTNSMGAA